ncbi:ECF-type sigma factor [Blastopirellula marina]|uniref:RNA polymerase sigma-70 ECF-like HTH domain-containing protein n=1 Tax=Blastopirellula marina DSM 3645 TaxID=314230 RepID=A3ZRY0_9BACT|nr:ECF-type sigma factor [Blastopirellula marina]EAQ80902.1 hypothetical protein DSM3645_12816 [Blastopirellula marina DSM 3645]
MNSYFDVDRWRRRLQVDPNEAMHQFWRTFYLPLVRYARNQLKTSTCRHCDEEDIAIISISAFYQAASQNRYPDIEDEVAVWKLLLTIVARNARRAIQHERMQKRGGGRVRRESDLTTAEQATDGSLDLAVETSHILETLQVDERIDSLDQMRDDRLREIVIRKLQGYTHEEIGAALGCTARTVSRRLNRVRSAWTYPH